MNYKDFNLEKTYGMCGVGYFTEHLYAMQFLTGAVCAPEFHCITKEEFDTFDDWKDTSKIRMISNRLSFGLPLCGSVMAEFSEIDVLGEYYQYNLERLLDILSDFKGIYFGYINKLYCVIRDWKSDKNASFCECCNPKMDYSLGEIAINDSEVDALVKECYLFSFNYRHNIYK